MKKIISHFLFGQYRKPACGMHVGRLKKRTLIQYPDLYVRLAHRWELQ